MDDPSTTEFVRADLTGARFEWVRLPGATFRWSDLSGVVMRSVDLTGAELDVENPNGLLVNGVDVGPLVEAELARQDPARALWRTARTPDQVRAVWAAIEQSWAATYQRVAAMPAGTVDVSVWDEWSFAQTLRHLVHATDSWIGVISRGGWSYHPWGLPFTDMPEFTGKQPADFGIDVDATPSYAEVLDLRADRVTKVREFIADITPQRLADEHEGPPWIGGAPVSVLHCLQVIFEEECEHHRFARRDLDAIESRG